MPKDLTYCVLFSGGKNKETPLHIAAHVDEGDKCAQMLLKSGADPNIMMENGETPLHVAARHGRFRVVRLLLQDGASLTQKSKVSQNSFINHLTTTTVNVTHVTIDPCDQANIIFMLMHKYC